MTTSGQPVAGASGARVLHVENRVVALVGRPNSGKSSLYNRLTGGRAEVANYPGVTVEIHAADVPLPGGGQAHLVDLPGLYSLDAAMDPATDEGVARQWLHRQRAEGAPLVVVQVVDGNRLALGLRLANELLDLGLPLVLAVTQRDVLERAGWRLDVAALSAALGVPVVHVSAHDPATPGVVLDAVARTPSERPAPSLPRQDPGTLASRVVMEAENADASARARRARTDRLDAVLLHPVAGPAAFLGLMTLLFAGVFAVAGPTADALDAALRAAGDAVRVALGDGMLASFVADGMLGGAGTVLGFLPQVVLLGVGMELLQATGYLARGAFILDRVLQALGLSGRAFVPLLMGHACAVPAITATRVIRDPFERLVTILVMPLMACAARIPTYGLLIAAFLSSAGPLGQAMVFVGLYAAGILSGLVASLVLRRAVLGGRSLPLVMEMPDYRAPSVGQVVHKAWVAATRFVTEVGTTILVVSAVLWALLAVPMPGADPALPPMERSVAAAVGRAMEPVTRAAGFDWRINVGLVASFGARELMVGTLGVIHGVEADGDEKGPLATRLREARLPDGRPAYPLSTGLALMAFFVLACQCMSTVAAIRRETRSWRWPALVLAYTYTAAFAAAVVVRQVVGWWTGT